MQYFKVYRFDFKWIFFQSFGVSVFDEIIFDGLFGFEGICFILSFLMYCQVLNDKSDYIVCFFIERIVK